MLFIRRFSVVFILIENILTKKRSSLTGSTPHRQTTTHENSNSAKNIKGSEFFLPSTNIEMGLAWSQGELKRDHMLKDMDLTTFAERLAYHYDNYNFVHPFREGNGRTQRVMWTLLSHAAGYDLDWRQVSGNENDEASRLAAENRDYSALTSIFMRIARPCDSDQPFNMEFIPAGHLDEC